MQNNVITILTGCAGSGKSTQFFARKGSYAYTIAHDEWAAAQYMDPDVKEQIARLLPSYAQVTKASVKTFILPDVEKNTILKNFFKVRFCLQLILLANSLTRSSILVECPFIDDNLIAFKNMFPDRVSIEWINCGDLENRRRLLDRGWDTERIDQTLKSQNAEYIEWRTRM